MADDPLSEQAHRLLMRLHYRRGDRSAALAAHARCRQILRDELSAEPSSETRMLAQLIERSGELPGSALRPVPTAIARPPLLIGREREWRLLEDAWQRGKRGHPAGDAGMGKTRLLGDFAHSRGIPLIDARPGDERVPYALLARLLRSALGPGAAALRAASLDGDVRTELARVLPELGTPPIGTMNEARFRQAVTQALGARRAAGLAGLALDDLHFADAASLELLPLLAVELRLALAVRGAETPATLAGWQSMEDGAALVEVALPPLTEADVRQLLDSLSLEGIDSARLAAPLAQHTAGNPYFVLETLGALVTQPEGNNGRLPTTPTVGALIERRLAQLSPPALRLARVAALARADFNAALAAHVLQTHPLDLTEAWAELERAHVLRGDGFVHDLIGDVAARAVPAPIAGLLHRGIAEYLEAQSIAPARIAQHYAEAGAWHRAADFHLRAANDARRASRRVEEAGHRESAFACLDRAGDAEAAFEARCASVESLILVRGVEHAQRVIEDMLAAARTDAQKAAALTARATAALMAGDHVTGVASARQALALAQGHGSPWPRFEAARLLAVGLAQEGRTDEAEAELTPFEGLVAAEGSVERRGHYWSDLAYVLNSARRLGRTAEALARAIDCAHEQGDLAEARDADHQPGHRARQPRPCRPGPRAGAARARAAGRTRRDRRAHRRRDRGARRPVQRGARPLRHRAAGVRARARPLPARRTDDVDCRVQQQHRHDADRSGAVRPRAQAAGVRGPVGHARSRTRVAAGSAHRAAAGIVADGGPATGARDPRARRRLLHRRPARTRAGRNAGCARGAGACDAELRAAESREFGGIAMKARLLAARAALNGGDAAVVVARWNALEALLPTLRPVDCYPPTAAAIGRDVLLANGEAGRAAQLLATAVTWIQHTAAAHVPDAYRDSFLHRNPINRALLTAASRRQ